MDPNTFTSASWGRVLRTPEGYWAFCPANLPAPFDPTISLMNKLSRADLALGKLGGTARNLKNPHLLIRPFVRKEAVLSSRIEGTQASLSDLMVFEATEAYGTPYHVEQSDVREVANYVRALEFGLSRLATLPLSKRLLRELHQILMEGVRGEFMTPGEFRRSQNWIGPGGCTLATATYVPPPVAEMHDALDALEKFLHETSDIPVLLRLAMIHYQFEAIHPFLDGNGRVGRLLISLLCVSEGLLPEPLLYLSAYIERRRDEYYRRLLAVSREGRWNDWLEYFLEGVAEQATDALLRSTRLLNLWEEYRKLALGRAAGSLLLIIDDLFTRPVTTIRRVQQVTDTTHRAARLNVERLVALGILRRIADRGKMHLFEARGIFEAIESPLPAG